MRIEIFHVSSSLFVYKMVRTLFQISLLSNLSHNFKIRRVFITHILTSPYNFFIFIYEIDFIKFKEKINFSIIPSLKVLFLQIRQVSKLNAILSIHFFMNSRPSKYKSVFKNRCFDFRKLQKFRFFSVDFIELQTNVCLSKY